MKIRFLENLAGARECFRAGSVYDLAPEQAAEFLTAKLAEELPPPAPTEDAVAASPKKGKRNEVDAIDAK